MNTPSTFARRPLGALATAACLAIASLAVAPAAAQNVPAPATAAALDRLMAWERQDMGVAPPEGLHDGAFHGPTPNRIPGGQVITTKGLLPLLQQGMPVAVFHVLGGAPLLPNALAASWAAQPGSFDDATQQQLAQTLRQATRGSAETPLVFYCGGPQCWMSYNAALRAIRLGYRNVLWYRGGVEAWQRAGLPTGGGNVMAQGGQPGPNPGGGRPTGALPPDAFGGAPR